METMMNQEIKQLATEARLLTGWPNSHGDFQKFAELIIMKCIGLAEEAKETRWAVAPSQEQVVKNVVNNIKDHFKL
jgi:hypothetical protein